jgi:hypothetical protein
MKRVNLFFNQLKLITDPQKIKDYCALECKYVKANYSTFASQRKIFTRYRNYLKNFYFQDLKINNAIEDIKLLRKQINSDNPNNDAIIESAKRNGLSLDYLKEQYYLFLQILNSLRLTEFENNQINEDYTVKIKERRSAEDRKYILDVDGFINKAVEELESVHFMPKVLALSALTGRRVAEIGCTAKFEFIDNNHVLFTGQLKTKNKLSELSYPIPVLYDAKVIIKALDNLRLNFPKYLEDPYGFSTNYAPNMRNVVKKYKPFIEGDITPKDLRSIYAPIAYERYCLDKREHDTLFYTKILGHSEKDIYTCLSYLKYKIK